MKSCPLIALPVVLTAVYSCGGAATTAPEPTPPAVGDWYRLDHTSPARGATVRWVPGEGVYVTGTFCQASSTNLFTLAFIRDDGAEWASAGKPYQYCGMDFTGGWVFGPTASQDGLTSWANGHRINGVFLIGQAPLTTPPSRTSIGGVQWKNVVARFDIPLDWTVER